MEMGYPLLLLIGLLVSAILSFILLLPSKKPVLPPGPPSIPVIGNLLWLRQSLSFSNVETVVRNLSPKFGPIITLRIGSRPSIFITDRKIAHKALVELGAVFSSRLPPSPFNRFFNTRIPNISSAPYGDIWRLLRRNLTSEILHPAKVRLFSDGRRWVLRLLLRDLQVQSAESPQHAVIAMESFRFAMFSLLVLMCFGKRLDERAIREIATAQRELFLYASTRLTVLSFVPNFLSSFLFRERLRTLLRLRQRQRDLFLPLIRARRERQKQDEESFLYSYVDSLLGITIADEGSGGLTEEEVVALCSEFMTGGTDTTTTALQWIMAEIVARPDVQARLVEEVAEGRNGEEIHEDDLQRMPYLKAVIMEGLRLYPPTHFVIPHAASEDIILDGYLIPKNTGVNVLVADLGWDENVWEKPREFMPERFMVGGDGEGADITGSKEIKMMPFGAGRRICPGLGLAMLHLEYFVANLVREFKWGVVDGEAVDLSPKSEFTVVMKKPLRATIAPRRNA